ncbi:MAG TPA: dienelactone hydrolase family protein [Beijerinckiaceae bacterium]|jgi:dienelactone hydrolase|nr:dienelactone hydrolase family protein [Beijerinckiaceae bacterium]
MRVNETIDFPTRTPEGFDQILHNVRDLPPVTIQGLLQMPQGGSGAVPLVITSIGSRGLTSGREALYAEALDAAGIAMLVVDSYSARGFTETVSDQGKFSFAGSAADALFALDHMRHDARFDPDRIALLGYSRGGMVTVMSYDERLQEAVVGSAARFCAHVALYPPCYLQWQHPQPTKAPMLMIFGGRDVQAPAESGIAYADRLRQAGGIVETIVYPEAVHSFDASHPAAPTGGINLGLAEIMVEDGGSMLEKTSGLRADQGWACFLGDVRKARGREGSITGYGPLPRDIAVAPILTFLRSAFGM